jgi:hypothetical protein
VRFKGFSKRIKPKSNSNTKLARKTETTKKLNYGKFMHSVFDVVIVLLKKKKGNFIFHSCHVVEGLMEKLQKHT